MDQEMKKEFEDLTQIIKSGFDEVGRRFDEVDKRFEDNRREHQIMHQKLEDIELRLGNVAYNFEARDLEKRITRLETKLNLKAESV